MRGLGDKGMNKRHVEEIVEYLVSDDGDYQYFDNHGSLIRCKDCKYYDNWMDDKICVRLGSYHGNSNPDDYCSYAERKEP